MKLDDKFHSSRKVNSIPKRHRFQAVGLWAIAGSWVAGEQTDGFVPDYMIEQWGPTDITVESLVNAGLWERVRDGFAFCSWLEYNPSKAQTKAERESSAQRMKASRERRRTNSAGQGSEGANVAPQHGETLQRNTSDVLQRPDPTRPDPTRPTSPNGEGNAVAVRDQARKRATRIPEGFTPSPEVIEAMRAECPRVDLEAENRKFVDYWTAKAGKDATKLDWDATWRNWIRRAKDSNVAQFPSRQSASERAQAHLDTVAEAERLMGLR
ncbi:hypothetical protein M3G04_02480 [Dietzia cinnamea]|uniref:hypothetical protein n=1 Tax=Dietzia cinnamea TaxID=321318 RepID=UPI00223BC5F1|nr:hypothetical protein [Dietzia cinnamea]MCT2299777.1 hypothetical protein [Dietzia cinnamea]